MLVGARMAAWGASGWKNPYVTDGLVAMWDGEWNAGGGVHDAEATVWKDLTCNGYDFSWASGTAGVGWGGDYISLSNGAKRTYNISTIPFVDISYNATVEVVAKYDWKYSDNYANLQVPVRNLSGVFPCARFRGGSVGGSCGLSVASYRMGRVYAFYGLNNYTGSDWTTCTAIAPSTQTSSPNVIYCNGAKFELNSDYNESLTMSTNMSLLRPPRADAYVREVRIYNRQLTADEIAANYAVDAARFNLT